MARLPMWSSSGYQLLPALSDRQTPPPTEPAYIRDGFVGWIRIARVRPPMLFGPSSVHVYWPIPPPSFISQ